MRRLLAITAGPTAVLIGALLVFGAPASLTASPADAAAAARAVSVIGGGSPGELSIDVDTFMALLAPRASSTEATVAQMLPVAGTLSRLRADTEVDPGCNHIEGASCIASSWTLTVFRNGAPTAVRCTISGWAFLIPHHACVAAGTVHYAAGDTMSIRVTPSGGPTRLNPFEIRPAPSAIHWTAAYTTTS